MIAVCTLLCGGESFNDMEDFGCAKNGLVLGQPKVPDKTNEITAIPSLIRALNLHGCIVTIDAMGCQKRIAEEVVAAGADYVFSLKGNQESVHQEMRDFLEAEILAQAKTLAYCEGVEKDHGRLETRKVWLSDQLDWFEDRPEWMGLRTVGMVEATRETRQGTTTERRFFLSSMPLDVKRFALAVRGHWGVENQLHWVLDVQMNEDQSRARSANAAENLATLRRLALNLLKQESTKKRGIKGKQKNAGWDHKYLLKLLRLP